MATCYILLIFACTAVVSVTSQNWKCDYPSLYDFPSQYPNPGQYSTNGPSSTAPNRQTPPRINSVSTDIPFATVISRVGDDMNSIQQSQMRELYCLEVLDNLVTSKWQEDIERVSVRDLGNFSTAYHVPDFSDLYSNPEAEYIQEEGTALNKLDKCFRNLVSTMVPRMSQDEISCLNKMYPDYLTRESKTARMMERYIAETSRKQRPFRSIRTYYEMTETLFGDKNDDALDDEVRAVNEDMLMFYIKSEEDKSKRIFIIEQECEWDNVRPLREIKNENERYQKFGVLVKSLVNRYLVSAILHEWVPGLIIPEYRYVLWRNARDKMEKEIRDKVDEAQRQRRDAQFLCVRAAQLATKFFEDQKEILFDKMKTRPLSDELKTRGKYAYVLGLESALAGTNDNRLSHTRVLVNEFKEGHYCLTNFVRMVENHQRYMIATAFVGDMLPYGITYCQEKEMSAGLINPRYCKCQGTFCEKFGLATIRSERYQLILLPNGTYTVQTDPAYRVLPLDELVANANNRIAKQKFNTWWYRHQKNSPKLIP